MTPAVEQWEGDLADLSDLLQALVRGGGTIDVHCLRPIREKLQGIVDDMLAARTRR